MEGEEFMKRMEEMLDRILTGHSTRAKSLWGNDSNILLMGNPRRYFSLSPYINLLSNSVVIPHSSLSYSQSPNRENLNKKHNKFAIENYISL